jgi:D-alanyl-D-alanine carboxypeptidase
VLHQQNADTRLHPASLTKMMTLYIAFQAIERGEISLDTEVTITAQAATEPPSKLGLRTGQRIRLRYLIRAAAVKSANDCATAIGIAIAGSEAAFADRMNRTARAMGMANTTFRNAHGLTRDGHMSTARDMTTLGRHVVYDFPQYYNLFSRRSADAGIAQVANTNRRFLDAYPGADGIKTGYTNPAGFNLVASAQRGNERIIATVFGGTSTANRNARVTELLDLGFARAPSNARVDAPAPPVVADSDPEVVVGSSQGTPGGAGKTIRVSGLVMSSLRPTAREVPATALAAVDSDVIEEAVALALAVAAPALPDAPTEVIAAAVVAPPEMPFQVIETEQVTDAGAAEPEGPLASATTLAPQARPAEMVAAEIVTAAADIVVAPAPEPVIAAPEIVTRVSTSGGRNWGVNVGRYNSRNEAERVLMRLALSEMTTLDGSLRRISQRSGGYDANFMGLTRETADLACRRLQARGTTCFMIGTDG